MLPIGHEVKVISEANDLGQSLEDIDAEALTALLHGSHALLDRTVHTRHGAEEGCRELRWINTGTVTHYSEGAELWRELKNHTNGMKGKKNKTVE